MDDDRAREWRTRQDAMAGAWHAPPRPEASAAAAWITFALSLLLAPLALVSLILGAILASKGRAGAGATVMVLSVLVLLAWYAIATGSLT